MGPDMSTAAGSTGQLEASLSPSSPAPSNSPSANGSPREMKRRSSSHSEFPNRITLNITPAMAASLGRLRRRMRLKEGVIGRIGLMTWLATQDREYREDD